MAGKSQYSIEFKTQAVKRVIEDGLSAAQVARELGINHGTVMEWVRRYKEDEKEPFVGSGNLRSEAKKIRELEKQIKDLQEENAILKKAAAIFAQNQKHLFYGSFYFRRFYTVSHIHQVVSHIRLYAHRLRRLFSRLF